VASADTREPTRTQRPPGAQAWFGGQQDPPGQHTGWLGVQQLPSGQHTVKPPSLVQQNPSQQTSKFFGQHPAPLRGDTQQTSDEVSQHWSTQQN
jgi:hypothetical protein